MTQRVCLHADYSELGRGQPDLRTARREGRTGMDTLAGGWQAAFGKYVQCEDGEEKETSKLKTLQEKVKVHLLNMQMNQGLGVIVSLFRCSTVLSLCGGSWGSGQVNSERERERVSSRFIKSLEVYK